MPDVQPSRMLAIILGSASFPEAPKFADGTSFYKSAYDVKQYLLDQNGLSLSRENILWLFEDSLSAPDQLKEIMKFLARRSQELKSSGSKAEDLLLYYVGHGFFNQGDDAFCIAVKSTSELNEGMTSIRGIDLARVIKEYAAFLRRYLIFDCCFAASIYKEFQSGPLTAARLQLEREFPVEKESPERGTALLCSSSSQDRSKAPQGLDRTMFSSGLMQALRDGVSTGGPRLSFSELGCLVKENLRNAFPEAFVRPEVHSPDQRFGDIAQIPLFPNPAYRKPQSVKDRVKPAQTERRPTETERQKEKLARELKERKRIEAVEVAEKNRVAAEQAVVQNRLAAQEAAADRILEQRKRRLAEAAEKKRIAAERAAKERAREEAEQKRAAAQEAERNRLAAQEAAAERVLEQQRRKRAEAAEQKRIAAESAAEERPAKAAPASAPDETSTAEPGITGAGIVTAIIGVPLINILGFYLGHLWATFISSGSLKGFMDASFLSVVAGGILATPFRPIARIAALGKGFRYVAFALWPGFLIGFRFVNDLSTESQPSVGYALAGIFGFLVVALSKEL